MESKKQCSVVTATFNLSSRILKYESHATMKIVRYQWYRLAKN